MSDVPHDVGMDMRDEGRSTRPAGPQDAGADGHAGMVADRNEPRLAVNGDGRRETPMEKLDRNWNEILQELRVTQTGIQILTGFLLTVPFQQRFTELTTGQKSFYLGLVLLAAVTTGFMVAPVSLHRWLFRRRAKKALVGAADRFMRIGLIFLALTVSGVVLLVFDVVVGRTAALWASGLLLLLLVLIWFVLPTLLGGGRQQRRETESAQLS